MKKQVDLQLLATLTGGVLFNYLFWMEKQALNLLLYSLFILAVLLLDKEMIKSKKLLLTGSSHLLAAVLVVINQSDLTIISWYISLAVFVGFAHFQSLRSVFTALIGTFLQLATVPVNLLKKLISKSYRNFSFSPLLKPIKYIVIPFIVLVLFSILYSIANPVFARYLGQLLESIGTLIENVFNFFFDNLSFLRFLHAILGIALAAAIFIGFKDRALEDAEAAYDENLRRQRKARGPLSIGYEIVAVFAGNLMNRKMALKTENTIGILSFAILNLLLLFLNAIDINTLWLSKNTGSNLSAELHDGTTALIISIVMAMLVILYFFSGNLNFYSKNKVIRTLAYIWIVQNAFLVASVLFQDFNYITTHGLTYKRIGVLIFLLLCTLGLATVYLKVAKYKTVFYLCRVNSFAWYVLLLAFGFVNWDVFIVSYNIERRHTITLDFDHLMSMSDKTLPLLHSNKETLKPYLAISDYSNKRVIDTVKAGPDKGEEQIAEFEKDLDHRIKTFKRAYAEKSWLSWNYRDWQTHRYLIRQHL